MIRRSGTSLIPPSTKGYKQSIGSVCSPHMAMRETCPHEKLWVFQTVWWAKLKHDEYNEYIRFISYMRLLFHWFNICCSSWNYLVVIDMVTLVVSPIFLGAILRGCALSICFWWIMSSQVVKSLHLFTRVNGWWPNFLDQLWWLLRAYVAATNVAIRSTQSFLQW